MTTYHAADPRATTGNPLCDKLRREYSQRCAAATHRSVPTAELVARVQKGLNPYENMPSYTQAPVTRTVNRVAPQQQARADRPMRRPAPVRTEAVKKNQAPRPTQGNAKKNVSASSRPVSPVRKSTAPASRVRRAPAVKEVRMANKPFPIATLSLLAIFTVMIMVIIVSFAQNYELSSDIAALEAQAQALAQSERELALALEERDDIRVIEDIAVNRIGMVRGNLVESRFVSVSGGDRIVLNNQNTDTADERGGYGLFSTMLSAIGENLDKLREYVD